VVRHTDQGASAGDQVVEPKVFAEVWTFPVGQQYGLDNSGAAMGAVDAGRTVQVHNTMTQEQEQDEDVRMEATSPLQPHEYVNGSGGEETACCESAEEFGRCEGAEELGGGKEEAGWEVERQDCQHLLRSQYW